MHSNAGLNKPRLQKEFAVCITPLVSISHETIAFNKTISARYLLVLTDTALLTASVS